MTLQLKLTTPGKVFFPNATVSREYQRIIPQRKSPGWGLKSPLPSRMWLFWDSLLIITLRCCGFQLLRPGAQIKSQQCLHRTNTYGCLCDCSECGGRSIGPLWPLGHPSHTVPGGRFGSYLEPGTRGKLWWHGAKCFATFSCKLHCWNGYTGKPSRLPHWPTLQVSTLLCCKHQCIIRLIHPWQAEHQ